VGGLGPAVDQVRETAGCVVLEEVGLAVAVGDPDEPAGSVVA
jgi:hypothetical protein